MIRPKPDLIFPPSLENLLSLIVAYANARAQIDLMETGLFKSWPPRFRLNSAVTKGGPPPSLQMAVWAPARYFRLHAACRNRKSVISFGGD